MAARSSGHSRSEGPSPRTYGARTAPARTARAGSRPSPPAPAHRRSPGAAAGARPSAPAATRTRRRPATPSSEDVGAKATGLDDGDPASADAHDPGPLQRGEEPADALARGPGELGEVRLRHVDRDALPAHGSAVLGDQLREHPSHAARHGLEGLAGDALVGLAETLGERRDQLDGDLRAVREKPP